MINSNWLLLAAEVVSLVRALRHAGQADGLFVRHYTIGPEPEYLTCRTCEGHKWVHLVGGKWRPVRGLSEWLASANQRCPDCMGFGRFPVRKKQDGNS